MRNPEDVASAILTIVQDLDESEDPDSYVEPLVKAINNALKERYVGKDLTTKGGYQLASLERK